MKTTAKFFAIGVLGLTGSLWAIPTPTLFYSYDGNTLDQSGNGYDGVPNGGGFPTYSSMVPSGSSNAQSLVFDGANDYVAISGLSYGSAGAIPSMTASVWFKTSFASGGAWTDNWLFLDWDRSEYLNISITPAGQLAFATEPATGALHDQFGTTTGLNDGNWHHATFVYDGTDKRIYVDGVLDGTISNAHGGAALGNGTTRFGFSGDGSEAGSFNGGRNNIYYDGFMSDMAYWEGTALTQTDISALASGTSPGSAGSPALPDGGSTLVLLGLSVGGILRFSRKAR